MNTMMALPFIVVLAFTDLPFWKDVRVSARWGLRLASAAVVLLIWPFGSTVIAHPIETLRTTSARFNRAVGEVAQPDEAPIAFRRATAKLSDEPLVATGGPPMREFLEFANQLHADIGDRPVYVASTFFVYSSLYYFVADLRPAPFLGDPEIMIINSERRRQSIAHMRRHIAGFRALATTNLGSDEARVFLESYPQARTIRRTLMQQELFVLIADEEPRR